MPRRLTLCHTSDWHLGHSLHGHSRGYEHERFLSFLLDVLVREQVDGLVIAGDVFDGSNPPAAAQAQLFGFLAEARARAPKLDVLMIAGNHDSAARLGASDPVLRHVGVRVVGPVPRLGAGGSAPVDGEAMVVPIRGADGEVGAWVAAVPFLRPSDLPTVTMAENEADPFAGVRRVYDTVLGAARARLEADQALIATGHCHMVDTTQSEKSERRIIGGLDRALPVDLFGADVDYVALGHLHLPQRVGKHDHVRYSGSPIPLAMPEESYPHQLRLVRFEGGRLAGQSSVPIPRSVEVYRVPRKGPAPLEEVLTELEELSSPESAELHTRPFLEVRVRLTEPVPDLRARVEAALAGRAVRLVRIVVEYAARGDGVGGSGPRRELSELTVSDVFRRAYALRYEGEPRPALLSAFEEVVAAAQHRLEGGEA